MGVSATAMGTMVVLMSGAVVQEAGVVVPEMGVQKSVMQRVAEIRAKATQRSAAPVPDVANAWLDRPAQVAWNDWKNQ
jgi:hypothetical protein